MKLNNSDGQLIVAPNQDALFRRILYNIPTTFYTHCYPISTQQDTILDIVVMTEFYLQRLDVCRLITFKYVNYYKDWY